MAEKLDRIKMKWKKYNPDPSFYDFVKQPELKKTLRGLVVPDQVKVIQESLNKIVEI